VRHSCAICFWGSVARMTHFHGWDGPRAVSFADLEGVKCPLFWTVG